MTTQVTRSLQTVDWNFSNSSASTGVHTIHPYPAKFIPEIPRELINMFFKNEGSVLLDPFCGSGTTLVEAVENGIDAWGVDLNPLACLISKVKTNRLPAMFENVSKEVTEKARKTFVKGNVTVPDIPKVDHWFELEIQKALTTLMTEINKIKSPLINNALKVSLSKIIVRVSNQESDTRYAAISKNFDANNVFDSFLKSALNIYEAVNRTMENNLFRKIGKAKILNENILTLSPDKLPSNVGLVITSTPYPNAYEYWLYHKYRMYWLGMNPLKVKEQEIGARPHYFKKNPQDETDFEVQMSQCFKLLSQIMLEGSKACFLIGRSIIHGRTIDNASLLKRASEPHGFVVDGMIKRDILSTRKTFNPSHGKIKEEHLMVFSLRKKICR